VELKRELFSINDCREFLLASSQKQATGESYFLNDALDFKIRPMALMTLGRLRRFEACLEHEFLCEF
jgi:hypothetical protein